MALHSDLPTVTTLDRGLGPVEATTLVVGGIIGASIFLVLG